MRVSVYIVMREARERASSHLNGEGEEDYNGSIERERGRMRGVQRDSSPKIEWKAVRSAKERDERRINTHGTQTMESLTGCQLVPWS
jgi:hypothetical protein